MYKLSRVSFFLFIFIFNYIWLRAIFIDYFFTIYENMSVIYSVLFSVIIVLVFLLIPEKIYRNDFHKNYNKSKIKYIIKTNFPISFYFL